MSYVPWYVYDQEARASGEYDDDDEFDVSWSNAPARPPVIDLTQDVPSVPLPPHVQPIDLVSLPSSYVSPVPNIRRRSTFERLGAPPPRSSPYVRNTMSYQDWKDRIVARMIQRQRAYKALIQSGLRIYLTDGTRQEYVIDSDGVKHFKPSWDWEDYIEPSDHNVRVVGYFRR